MYEEAFGRTTGVSGYPGGYAPIDDRSFSIERKSNEGFKLVNIKIPDSTMIDDAIDERLKRSAEPRRGWGGRGRGRGWGGRGRGGRGRGRGWGK